MPEVQETLVQSLGQEDPLEKDMGTHSSILAWKILWTEEPGECTWGSKRVGLDLVAKQQQFRNLFAVCALQILVEWP